MTPLPHEHRWRSVSRITREPIGSPVEEQKGPPPTSDERLDVVQLVGSSSDAARRAGNDGPQRRAAMTLHQGIARRNRRHNRYARPAWSRNLSKTPGLSRPVRPCGIDFVSVFRARPNCCRQRDVSTDDLRAARIVHVAPSGFDESTSPRLNNPRNVGSGVADRSTRPRDVGHAAQATRPVVQVGHLEHVLTIAPAIVRGFAQAVADSLQDGVLPYADRQRLLRRATRLGIGRFDANLIIASVQHRQPARDAPPRSGVVDARGWKRALLIVLTIEATLAGVVGWLFLL